MAVDGLGVQDPEEINASIRKKPCEQEPQSADDVATGHPIAETRTRAECGQALRAAVEGLAGAFAAVGASADASPPSAWDKADPVTRPPLDAIHVPWERSVHILEGDATGGGHRPGTGKPGKTEFPASWGDDKITDCILSVARSPDSATLQKNGRWNVKGVRDEVTLAVIIIPDGRVWSAYPLPGSPGVRQNPKDL